MWNPFTPKVKPPNTPLQGEAETLSSPLNNSAISIPPPPSLVRTSESKETDDGLLSSPSSSSTSVPLSSPRFTSSVMNYTNSLNTNKVPISTQDDLLSIINLAGSYLSYDCKNKDILVRLAPTVTNRWSASSSSSSLSSNTTNNGPSKSFTLFPTLYPGPLHLSSYQLPLTHTQQILRSDILRNTSTTLSVQVDVLHTVFSPSFTLLPSSIPNPGMVNGTVPTAYRVVCSLLTNDTLVSTMTSPLSSPVVSKTTVPSASSSSSSSTATYHDITPAYPLQHLFGSPYSKNTTDASSSSGIPYIVYHQPLLVSSILGSTASFPSSTIDPTTDPAILHHPNPSPTPFTVRLQLTFDNTSINLPSTVGALHIPPTSIIATVDIDLTMVSVNRSIPYPLRIRWLPTTMKGNVTNPTGPNSRNNGDNNDDTDEDDNYIFMDILLHVLSNPNQTLIERNLGSTITVSPPSGSVSTMTTNVSSSLAHPLYQSRIFDPILYHENIRSPLSSVYLSSLHSTFLNNRHYWLHRRKDRTLIPSLPNGSNRTLNGRTWPWKTYQKLPNDFWNPPDTSLKGSSYTEYSSIAITTQIANIIFHPSKQKKENETVGTTPRIRVLTSLITGNSSTESKLISSDSNRILTNPMYNYDATSAQPIQAVRTGEDTTDREPMVAVPFYESLLVYQKGYYHTLHNPEPIFLRIQIMGEDATDSTINDEHDTGLVVTNGSILGSIDMDMTLVPLNTNLTVQLHYSSFLPNTYMASLPFTGMTMDVTLTMLTSPNVAYLTKHTIVPKNYRRNSTSDSSSLANQGTVQLVIHKADILCPSSPSSANDNPDKFPPSSTMNNTNNLFNLSVTQSIANKINDVTTNNSSSGSSNLALMSVVANNYEHQQSLLNPSTVPSSTNLTILPRTLCFSLRTMVTSSASSLTPNGTTLPQLHTAPSKTFVDVYRLVPPNGILDILAVDTVSKFTAFDLPNYTMTNTITPSTVPVSLSLPIGYSLQDQLSLPFLSYTRTSSIINGGGNGTNTNRLPIIPIGAPVYSGCSGSSLTTSVPLSSYEFPPANTILVLQMVDVQAFADSYTEDTFSTSNSSSSAVFPIRAVPIGRVLATSIIPYPTDVFESTNSNGVVTTASSSILCTRKSYTSFPLFHPDDIHTLPYTALLTAVPSHVPILAQIQCLVSLWTGIAKPSTLTSSSPNIPTPSSPQDNLISREISTIASLFTERACTTTHNYYASLLKPSSLAVTSTDTILSTYPWLTTSTFPSSSISLTTTRHGNQRTSRSHSISSDRSVPLNHPRKDPNPYTVDHDNYNYDMDNDILLSGKTRSPGSRERLDKLLGDTASMSVAAALTFGSTKEVGKAEGLFGKPTHMNDTSSRWDSIDTANPSPTLVKKLIMELDRRTDALRISGEEILQLRKQLRLSQENYTFLQKEYTEKVAEQTKADDQILLQALRDIGPSALLAAPNSPGFHQLTTLSATQILHHLQQQDPTGTTVVPNLIRRLTVLAQRFVQERRANTALTAEVASLKNRIKTLEKETAALLVKTTVNSNYDGKKMKKGESKSSSSSALDTSLDGSTITSSLPLLTNDNTNLIVNYDGTLMQSAFPLNPPPPLHGTKESLTSHLIMAETAMGLGVGGLLPGQAEAMILARYANLSSPSTGSVSGGSLSSIASLPNDPVGPYTSTLVTGNSLLDPAAPVSAITHAKLLDAYAAAVNEMDTLRSTTARAHAHAKEISDAHQASMVAIQTLQAEVRDNSVLKSTVKNQQALIKKLEQALEKTHQRIAGASKKEHLLRKEIEKRDIAIHRGMNPEYEGDLIAHLRTKDARISILEDEMKATASTYALEISRAQTRIVELEEQLLAQQQSNGTTGLQSSPLPSGRTKGEYLGKLPLTKTMNAASVPKPSVKIDNDTTTTGLSSSPSTVSKIDLRDRTLPDLTNQLENDLQAIDTMLNNLGLLDGSQTQAEDYLRYSAETLANLSPPYDRHPHSSSGSGSLSSQERPPSVQSIGLGISALLHPSRGSTPYNEYNGGNNNHRNSSGNVSYGNYPGSMNTNNGSFTSPGQPSHHTARPPLPSNPGNHQNHAPSVRRISSTSTNSTNPLPLSYQPSDHPSLPMVPVAIHRPSIVNNTQSPSVSMMVPLSNTNMGMNGHGGRSRAPSKLSLNQ